MSSYEKSVLLFLSVIAKAVVAPIADRSSRGRLTKEAQEGLATAMDAYHEVLENDASDRRAQSLGRRLATDQGYPETGTAMPPNL